MARRRVRWIALGVVGAVGLLSVAYVVGAKTRPAPMLVFGGTRGVADTGAGTGGAEMAPVPAAPIRAAYSDQASHDSVKTSGVRAGATLASAAGLGSFGDRIIRTADMTVQVRSGTFDEAWRAAIDVAQQLGGQVLSSSRGDVSQPIPMNSESSKKDLRGDIVIRVPTARYEDALQKLGALGKVRGETETSEDVTQEYVDLQSRLRNSRAEEAVLLRLFARAKSVADTMAIEARLSEVQGQIEEITGRIRYLNSRTDFATVTVHLAEPGAVLFGDDGGPSLGKAWDTALAGLVRIGGAVLILAVWFTPFAVLVLLLAGAWRLFRRPASEGRA